MKHAVRSHNHSSHLKLADIWPKLYNDRSDEQGKSSYSRLETFRAHVVRFFSCFFYWILTSVLSVEQIRWLFLNKVYSFALASIITLSKYS